eukprot:CAMPEP_0180098438 /NCGR_PEP_ID=MMETSP0985-20121206/27753_1 /TAXON_ID=483367 /ORGANISM="non described non described, Strain CCMP 2436" /LENGTH=71 /DNA_ID=CAMNT_0022033883 /DNA_START=81 /DNA_END=293 /DNA_ORIENTATION=+
MAAELVVRAADEQRAFLGYSQLAQCEAPGAVTTRAVSRMTELAALRQPARARTRTTRSALVRQPILKFKTR